MGRKRLPGVDELITIDSHGANKLSATWFKSLMTLNTEPIIIGIDEAGRGPVFGPMVVGGAINLTGWRLAGVKDSKQVKNETTRRTLAAEIQHNCIWATAVVTADVINQYGTQRTLLAAGNKVARELYTRLRKYRPDHPVKIIFDGNDHASACEDGCTIESIEKADATIYEVSCASLLAKVLHDNLIHEIVKTDPKKYGPYDLANNKGYGTPKHKEALELWGRTDHHRKVATDTLLGLNENAKSRKIAIKRWRANEAQAEVQAAQ